MANSNILPGTTVFVEVPVIYLVDSSGNLILDADGNPIIVSQ